MNNIRKTKTHRKCHSSCCFSLHVCFGRMTQVKRQYTAARTHATNFLTNAACCCLCRPTDIRRDTRRHSRHPFYVVAHCRVHAFVRGSPLASAAAVSCNLASVLLDGDVKPSSRLLRRARPCRRGFSLIECDNAFARSASKGKKEGIGVTLT